MNALVIETAFLGDVIVSLGLASELKRLDSSCHVTYLVRPDAQELASASPSVDRVVVYDKRGQESGPSGIRRKASYLNEFRFDTVFLLHGSQRSQLLTRALTSRRKIGFEAMTKAGLTDQACDRGWKSRYERVLFLARAFDPGAVLDTLPTIEPPNIRPDLVAKLHNYPASVVLAPGSAWRTKKWGDSRFYELAIRLREEGLGVIIIGGRSERAFGEQLEDECDAINLAGRASLLEAAAAIKATGLLVANDSAPVHLATAVGAYSIAIFGPTVPEFGFAPPTGRGEVIESAGLWCRPCTAHGSDLCPLYTHACMEQITVGQVMQRIRARIEAIQ